MMHRNIVFSVLALVCGVLSITVPLRLGPEGAFYHGPVTFGNQTLELLIDTGSPQTWVVTNSSLCYAPQGRRVSCSTQFGKLYNPSSTFKYYNGSVSNGTAIEYADGSQVRGTWAFENLRVGNSEVEQVRIITADVILSTTGSYWPCSGLLGLGPAPPPSDQDSISESPDAKASMSLSRPFALAQPHYAKIAVEDDLPGQTVLPSIFNQTDLPAFYGLALSRTDRSGSSEPGVNSSFAGLLTIGVEASISSPYINASVSNIFASVPLEKEVSYYDRSLAYRHDMINCTAIVIGRDRSTAQVYPFVESGGGPTTAVEDASFIVDSGAQINIIPYLHAALVNSQFKPPARADRSGLWLVDCNARAPEVGVLIAGEMFPINKEDMISEFELENRTTICASSMQGGASGRGVLGAPFLRNVYVEVYREEYDGPEAATMWLASREFYATY